MPLSHGVPETSLTGHHPSFPNGWLDAHVVQPFHVCPSLTPPNKHLWQGRSSCIDEEDKNRESSRALPDLDTVICTKFTSKEFDLLALADQKSVENMYEQSIYLMRTTIAFFFFLPLIPPPLSLSPWLSTTLLPLLPLF